MAGIWIKIYLSRKVNKKKKEIKHFEKESLINI